MGGRWAVGVGSSVGGGVTAGNGRHTIIGIRPVQYGIVVVVVREWW